MINLKLYNEGLLGHEVKPDVTLYVRDSNGSQHELNASFIPTINNSSVGYNHTCKIVKFPNNQDLEDTAIYESSNEDNNSKTFGTVVSDRLTIEELLTPLLNHCATRLMEDK